MRPELISFDAYAALSDYRSSLLPAVKSIPHLDSAQATDFLELWRARQLGVTALSNALERGRISFRDCTALALDYALNRYNLELTFSTREELIYAWYPLAPWPEANSVLSALTAKGYRLAILSNKPHPSVYAVPIRELGIDNYLHVAGSANDVIGARAAGVSCYWSNRQGDCVTLPDYGPDHQGSDLTGILGIV
jgi:FMN phosphatase YigB (HAD superfamily)